MTTMPFHTTVPSDCTITLPPEFRGVPVRIVVEEKTTVSKQSTMREFVTTFSGILKDCGLESTDALKEERINDRIRRHQ